MRMERGQPVTGLTVEDFQLLNRIGLFNPQHMNAAIYQFKAFEIASLHYADSDGVGDLHGNIGLWDTVVDADDMLEHAHEATS